MKFSTEKPKNTFEAIKHKKLYPKSLPEELYNLLDQESFQGLPLNVLREHYPALRTITFMRHFESNYNSIKAQVLNGEIFKEFQQTENNTKKEELFNELIEQYEQIIITDYLVGLSEKGHKEGEKLSILYASMIEKNPELMPKLIIISPYLRTRLTAHYLLQKIKGLDVEHLDQLKQESMNTDQLFGSFYGQDIEIRNEERVREKDHGNNPIPQFLRKYDPKKHKQHTGHHHTNMEYFSAPNGGESQTQVNARIKEFLQSMMNHKEEKYKNILVVSHHLAMMAALLQVFGGTINTFDQVNSHRHPANGNFAFFSQLEKTQNGKEGVLRLGGRNLRLIDNENNNS